MRDLNDLVYFAAVVAHGGFAPASRALRVPKSKLSRHVASLESYVGLRLLERTSRQFGVTEVGKEFYARCQTILDEIAQAEATLDNVRREPQGRVRMACPTGYTEMLAGSLAEFAERFPKVELQIAASDEAANLVADRIDVALRARVLMTDDPQLVTRGLGRLHLILVASAAVAERLEGQSIECLSEVPKITPTDKIGEACWELRGPGGDVRAIRFVPRLSSNQVAPLRQAVIAGLGVGLLADFLCCADIDAGRMRRVFPEWFVDRGTVHLVYSARRGLSPAVRALIEHVDAFFTRAPCDA